MLFEQNRTTATVTFRHPLVENEQDARELLAVLGSLDLEYTVIQDATVTSVVEGVTTVTLTFPASYTGEEFADVISHGIEYGSVVARKVTHVTVDVTTPDAETIPATEAVSAE